ncbi:MAG TPA: LacI family DNA-binding transcriptional regulator [Tabrizicola sp.]|nr:LacI family DNA-binding transcriptional regulator [Tabrizicola sp.]
MGKTTILDVATKAGVSTATVDRVLNGRPGVSAANRHRVLQAAKELGYLPFEGMVALPSRPVHLEFFIPLVQNGFMGELVASIRRFAATVPLVASCTIRALDGFGPENILPALETISLRTSGIGIVAADHPRSREAIRRICEAGLRVVTIASDLPDSGRSAYVGVDNTVAGRTAAILMGRMAGGGGPVGLFLGSRSYDGHHSREAGFRAVLERDYPALSLLPPIETGESSDRTRTAMTQLLRTHPNLAGVYCVGAGRTGVVAALEDNRGKRRPLVVMHDLTDRTRTWLADGTIDVVIDQNVQLVGEQAVIRLLGAIATTAPQLRLKDIEPRIILRENIPVQSSP